MSITLDDIQSYYETKGTPGLLSIIREYVYQENIPTGPDGVRTDVGGKDRRTTEDVYNDLMDYIGQSAPKSKSSPGATTPPSAGPSKKKILETLSSESVRRALFSEKYKKDLPEVFVIKSEKEYHPGMKNLGDIQKLRECQELTAILRPQQIQSNLNGYDFVLIVQV